MISEDTRARIKNQSKDVAAYMDRHGVAPDNVLVDYWYPTPATDAHLIMELFHAWFCETEGFGHREERFWNAIEYQDTKEAYKFLKTAWLLGYQAGRMGLGEFEP